MNSSISKRRGILNGFPAALLAALLISGVGAWLGCGGGESSRSPAGSVGPGEEVPTPSPEELRSQLIPLPELDLEAAEASVREHLERERRALEALLAADPQGSGATDPQEASRQLAGAFSDLGLLYTTYELLDAAEISMANAVVLDSKSFRYQYLLGYLKMIRGSLQEAVPLYTETLRLEPDFLPAHIRLGRTRLELAQPEAARDHFAAALELDQQSAAAREGLGRVAAALGEDATAVDEFRRALELDGEANAVHYALAQSLRNLGRLDESRHHLSLSGDVPTRVADPLINPLANLAESVQFYIVQGSEAMEDRRYEDAVPAFRAALERDETHFQAYRGLAISLERLGDRVGSRIALEEALERAEPAAGEERSRLKAAIQRSLGLLAALEGQEKNALDHYLASLELFGDQPDVLLRAGNGLARAGRFEMAIELFDRLASQRPEWASAILERRATALVNLSRFEEAVKDFEEAIEASPEDAGLRRRYAEALEFMSRPEEAAAQREAEKARLNDDGSRANALVDQARQAARSGDFKSAIGALEGALALRPDDLESRYTLAAMLAHSGRLEEAVEAFGQVLEASPRHEKARRDQVVALILSARYGEARVALQEALRLFPQHLGFALAQVELLATNPDSRVRDGELAVAIAERVRAQHQSPVVTQSLAFAYAAAGRFDEAMALQRALIAEAEKAEGEGAGELIRVLRQRLEKFESHEAHIATSPDDIVVPLMHVR